MKTKNIVIWGKDAQAFAMFLVVAVLLTTSYATFTFLTQKRFSETVTTPFKLGEVYGDSEKFLFFAKKAAEISIQDSYNRIASESLFAGKECMYDGNYISLCSLETGINEKFALEIKTSLDNLLKKYSDNRFREINYAVSVKETGDIIEFNSGSINLNAKSDDGSFPYTMTYSFNPSFSINISEMGLDDMKKVVETTRNCFLNSNARISDCTRQLKNFDVTFTIKEDKTFFDLNTKKKFFYSKDDTAVYDRITIRFFVQE